MDASLPGRIRIVIGLLVLIGAMSIWSGIDGSGFRAGELVLGGVHFLLAAGLYLKFNSARILTMIVSIGDMLVYLVSSVLFSVWGYAINAGAKHTESVLLGKEAAPGAGPAATTFLDVMQGLPWPVMIVGAVYMAIYIWIFYYLTTEEALAIFGKKTGD